MNLSGNGQRNLSSGFADRETEVKKYLRILKKQKWTIIITFLLIFVCWTTYVILYNSSPVYRATTRLYFQDLGSKGVLDAEAGYKINEAKATNLSSSTLLGKVVKELQLNLSIRTQDVNRIELFGYLNVGSNSVVGIYTIAKNDKKLDLFYSNEETNISNKHLVSFLPGDTIQINRITFQLNADYLANSPLTEIEFKVRNSNIAIKSLKAKTSYFWNDRKTKQHLDISATDGSRIMAAKIANVLAEKFVEFDSYLKNRKSYEAFTKLQEQKTISERDLAQANQKLQRFKEMNPEILNVNSLDKVSTFEQRKSDLKIKTEELRNFMSKARVAASFEEKLNNNRELLSLLTAEGIPSAQVFSEEFTLLNNDRAGFKDKYFPSHPKYKENAVKFNGLFAKIINTANEHIQKLDKQLRAIENKLTSARSNLANLPKLQRQLSDLVVQQTVKQDLYQRLLGRFNQAKINTEVEVSDVMILDPAPIPSLQGRFSIILQKSLFGLIVGLVLGIALAIVLDFFDKTVQTAEDLESKLKIPVIGSIPIIDSGEEVPDNITDIKGKRDTKLITLDYSPTLESESYRDLRTKLLFMNQNKNLSSFLLTSLKPNEGKSLTSSNLAITFAQQKISTLLIDGDLRRGVLHNVYGNKKKPGLGDFLISKATVDYDNVNKLIQKTIIPNLYIITTGSPIPNPTEMLGSERMTNLLNVLKSRFGMVIMDTSPFQASSDSAILASAIGGVVIVVRADYTNIEQLSQKLNEYPNIQENILGVVLNMVKVDMKKESYQYSYYNY